MAKWYYAVGTETAGPVDEDELRAMAVRGDLRPTTWVVPEGDTVWVQLNTVEDRLALSRDAEGAYRLQPGPADTRPAIPDPTTEAWPPTDEPWPAVPEPLAAGTTTAGTTTADTTPTGTATTGPGVAGPLAGVRTPDPVRDPVPNGPTGGTEPGPGWGAPAAPPATDSPAWWPDHPAYADPYHLANAGPGEAAFAPWGARLAAKVVDSVILLVPSIVVLRLVAWQDVLDLVARAQDSRVDLTYTSGPLVAANLIAAVIGLLYYAVLNGRGQTPGKALLGIRVVRATDGAPIGATKGLIRHVVQFAQVVPTVSILVGMFVLVDAVSPLWDDRRRALHDRFAGSVVIRSR